MKPCGLITLMSDFGLQDSYVAEMKGVILSINPKARLIDLSHLISPQEITIAAFRLWRAYRYFPKGTIHLAVVDPGVGTGRRLLLAVSEAYFFLAPDNGLLNPVLQERPARCYVLEASRWQSRKISHTFHGRDLLAPAAALLSLGRHPRQMGHSIRPVTTVPFWAATTHSRTVEGKVLDIDRFGNLITNLRASNLRRRYEIHYRKWRFSSLATTYGMQRRSRPVALIGSSGLLEIALPQGSAETSLKGSIGQKVMIRYG